ncbi:SDR family NAD(P)-dependent oxidoreductase [Pseudomonas japonica]|uniref:Short-chain dehydrogenase n=1 Tax=Pseudomonas japonica TaxID=256466 RepID=A0A239JYW7_9PSED|nr:SDR family NAD(P)-dependent oxidoreductase [Pseudomonas japonica]SNT10603.1 Short-chain dehydrogenase [Pseudomonas japonica]
MNTEHPKRIWVTGAGDGLGHALALHLLTLGHQVAVSGRAPLAPLPEQLAGQCLILDGDLSDSAHAERMTQCIQEHWGALDTLILNAGTCDYLDDQAQGTAMLEALIASNLAASRNGLDSALPLLVAGQQAHVVGILSSLTALQQHESSQWPTAQNSLGQWFSEARARLSPMEIDLTLVAPQTLKKPITQSIALPQQWTAESAALAIIDRLPLRMPEMVLEALSMSSLWPLRR